MLGSSAHNTKEKQMHAYVANASDHDDDDDDQKEYD
jgi:hypothetical protein